MIQINIYLKRRTNQLPPLHGHLLEDILHGLQVGGDQRSSGDQSAEPEAMGALRARMPEAPPILQDGYIM